MKSRILFVDDETVVLESLERLLYKERGNWEMHFKSDPAAGWESMTQMDFDAVVLDMRMPGCDGLEIMARMADYPRTQGVPVIFLTGEADRAIKRRALEEGATDFLSKPVDAPELRARLRSALRLKAAQDELKRQNVILAEKVAERTQQLHESRLDLIWRLAKAAEYRDEETGHHVVRVGCYAREIGTALGLEPGDIETLYVTAPLHDIGKIGIRDEILLKPGLLTPEERWTMQEHCAIGLRILREESKAMASYLHWRGINVRERAETPDPIIETACEIVHTHHERWDGTGYPRGLAGEDIPLPGRIVAICDVFDALTSARPYKEAFSEQRSLEIIRDGAGTHFDPRVYEAFLARLDAIRNVRAELSDTPVDTPVEARMSKAI